MGNIGCSKSGVKNLHIFSLAKEGDWEELKQMIQKNELDVNIYSPYQNWSLIFYAIEQRRDDIVRFLKLKGANVNFQDKMNNTPLHLGVKFNDERITKVLCKDNPPSGLSIYNKDGFTPFHLSVLYPKCFLFLIKICEKPNILTRIKKQNVCHLFAKEFLSENFDEVDAVFSTMVEFNVNLTLRDVDGNTPVDLAKYRDSPCELITSRLIYYVNNANKVIKKGERNKSVEKILRERPKSVVELSNVEKKEIVQKRQSIASFDNPPVTHSDSVTINLMQGELVRNVGGTSGVSNKKSDRSTRRRKRREQNNDEKLELEKNFSRFGGSPFQSVEVKSVGEEEKENDVKKNEKINRGLPPKGNKVGSFPKMKKKNIKKETLTPKIKRKRGRVIPMSLPINRNFDRRVPSMDENGEEEDEKPIVFLKKRLSKVKSSPEINANFDVVERPKRFPPLPKKQSLSSGKNEEIENTEKLERFLKEQEKELEKKNLETKRIKIEEEEQKKRAEERKRLKESLKERKLKKVKSKDLEKIISKTRLKTEESKKRGEELKKKLKLKEMERKREEEKNRLELEEQKKKILEHQKILESEGSIKAINRLDDILDEEKELGIGDTLKNIIAHVEELNKI